MKILRTAALLLLFLLLVTGAWYCGRQDVISKINETNATTSNVNNGTLIWDQGKWDEATWGGD